MFNAVCLFLKQLHPVIPWRAIHRPMFIINFINAQQHTILILPQIGKAFQIHCHRHFKINLFQHWNRIRNQIMMFQRRYRQLYPGHSANLFCPQASGIDHVLATDNPLIGYHPPALACLFQRFNLCMFKILCPAFACGHRIGMNRAGSVQIAFPVCPHTAQQPVGRHNRVQFGSLLRGDQMAIINTDRLKDAVGRLQPFPPVRRASHRQPAGHMQADILAAFFLNLLQQVNGIGLQACDIGVGIQRMNTARCMPGRPGSQNRAFQQAHIAPAHPGQMVKHRCANHAPANDHNTVMGIHIAPLFYSYCFFTCF